LLLPGKWLSPGKLPSPRKWLSPGKRLHNADGCSKADWRSSCQGSGLIASAQRPAGAGRINADGTGAQAGLLGEPWRRGFLGAPGDHIGDAQL
jgi:hypothetical protein